MEEVPQPEHCPKCGYELDSYACKIRHVYLNTGDAKAAND
jgi:hypothetical protein